MREVRVLYHAADAHLDHSIGVSDDDRIVSSDDHRGPAATAGLIEDSQDDLSESGSTLPVG